MLSVEELWSLIDREISELPAVRVPLAKALGRRLGAEIVADADMPAFSRSAIDGYALADGSGPGSFRVIGEARPGSIPFPVPAAEEAIRIFTGSALPDSGVGLVMIEDTSGAAQADRVVTRVAAGRAHVRSKGSQAKRGAVLLPPGATVTPGAVAVLASVGVTEPPVSPVARIAHLATGSELVDAHSRRPALFAIATPRWLPPSWRKQGPRGYFMRVFRRASNRPWRSWSPCRPICCWSAAARAWEPTMARSKF
jgi:molybdopterin molybdotransferase